MPVSLRRPAVWLIVSCAAFLAISILILPLPGIQNDEALFCVPLYRPPDPSLSISIHHHLHQVMLMSYLGALKAWIFRPIFWMFQPSVWSLRLPAALIGMLTIGLTWIYTRRVAGLQAAAITSVLLATDPSFLLTNTFDWGPVALQHVFLMLGLVCFTRWLDRAEPAALAFAFLAWGLGLWDKALFVWPLSGLVIAAVCVYPRQVLERLKPRTIAIAAASFCLGALPLIGYNIRHPGRTFTENSHFSLAGFGLKADALRKTLDGSIMFDALPSYSPAPASSRVIGGWARASVWLSQHAGNHHRTLLIAGMGIAILLAIVAMNRAADRPQRRQIVFLLVAMAIAFLQMAATPGAGAAAHHEILLWPFPVIVAAIGFARLSGSRVRAWRGICIAAVALLCAENLLTDNQYIAALLTNGPSLIWTDALDGLVQSVRAQPGRRFEIVDWGYQNSLILLSRGKVDVDGRADCLAASIAANSDCGLPAILMRPEVEFIQHTPENQLFRGVDERLTQIGANAGAREVIDRVIFDSFERPVFQLIHFERR